MTYIMGPAINKPLRKCPDCKTGDCLPHDSYCKPCLRVRANARNVRRRAAAPKKIGRGPARIRRPDADCCNCGDRTCTGLTCNVVRA